MKTVDNWIILTREELFDLVWKEPMRTLARRFGISDVALAKRCKRHDIPRPGVGYWAKKEHGRKVVQVKLPKNDKADVQEIRIYQYPPSPSPSPSAEAPKPLPVEMQRALEREKSEEWIIHVPEDNSRILTKVRALRSSLPRYTDLTEIYPLRTDELNNVKIAKESLDRAFRILDALLRAFKLRKYSLAKDKDGDTCVVVDGEEIVFDLVERLRRETYGDARQHVLDRPMHAFVASGRLALRVHDGWHWKVCVEDSNKFHIEDRLNVFITHLIWDSHQRKMHRAATEERERLRRIREAEEYERRCAWEKERREKMALIQAEEQMLKVLLQDARNWEESKRLRAFIAKVQTDASAQSQRQEMPMSEWLSWATAQADRLDPLVESPPSILDEKSKWEKR